MVALSLHATTAYKMAVMAVAAPRTRALLWLACHKPIRFAAAAPNEPKHTWTALSLAPTRLVANQHACPSARRRFRQRVKERTQRLKSSVAQMTAQLEEIGQDSRSLATANDALRCQLAAMDAAMRPVVAAHLQLQGVNIDRVPLGAAALWVDSVRPQALPMPARPALPPHMAMHPMTGMPPLPPHLAALLAQPLPPRRSEH